MIDNLLNEFVEGKITLRQALEKASESNGLKPESKVQIIIAPRGWIFVGYTHIEDTDIVIEKSNVIRNWGTTKGIGELINGPTSKTVLDPCGVTRVPIAAIVAKIDCREESWKTKI